MGAVGSAPRTKTYRSRIDGLLRRVERESGVPAKYALPTEIVGLGLLVAVLGMYWDIGTHIDQGRDETLFTISHSLIVGGIGICVFGAWLSMMIPGPASKGSLRIGGHDLPAGGLVLLICSAVALFAFPLDDVWHRLFGEDVTLWSPSHMLMIGGASLCALGIIVLMSEGASLKQARTPQAPTALIGVRKYLGVGGLLVALSTLQAEFDYGVPQFQMVFQPIMIAVAAGIGLVFARATLGRFGAIGAVLGFYVVRGGLALIVGPGLGHTLPHFPLYMGSAILIELIALMRWNNAISFGAAGGLAAGTVGFASEWGWSHVFMPHAWAGSMLPEAAVLSAVAGMAAGVLGARIAAATGAEFAPKMPRNRATATLVAASVAAIVVALAIPLPRTGDPGVRASIVPFGKTADSSMLRIGFSKPDYSKDAERFQVLAWQGGSSKRIGLEQVSPTTYVTKDPVPYGGNWKSMLRVQHGSKLIGAPVYLAPEPLTGKPAVPLAARNVALQRDTSLLLRESKTGVAGALTTVAYAVLALIAVGWMAALAFALSRAEGPPPGTGGRRRRLRSPSPQLQH